ncbi:unnamed protein product [Camellia sinensis]
MIVFVWMDIEIHSTAQIFGTWIGFLHREIHVKKKLMKGEEEHWIFNQAVEVFSDGSEQAGV